MKMKVKAEAELERTVKGDNKRGKASRERPLPPHLEETHCCHYTQKVERLLWLVGSLCVLVGITMWAVAEPGLFDHHPDFHLDVCHFVASEHRSNRAVAWAAVTGSSFLVTFSLAVESQLKDIAFHDGDPRRQAWKTTKRVVVREFLIAGSVAILVWVAEVVYNAAAGASRDPEADSGHSMAEVFLLTLEFLDKTMLLLMLAYLGLVQVGLKALTYISDRSDGSDTPRLTLVAVHFFLNFPYYVKIASFVLSLILLDDIFWPGADGYYTFVALLLIALAAVFFWLRLASCRAKAPRGLLFNVDWRRMRFAGGPRAGGGDAELGQGGDAKGGSGVAGGTTPIMGSEGEGEGEGDGKGAAATLARDTDFEAQLSWARHTKLLKQFVGMRPHRLSVPPPNHTHKHAMRYTAMIDALNPTPSGSRSQASSAA